MNEYQVVIEIGVRWEMKVVDFKREVCLPFPPFIGLEIILPSKSDTVDLGDWKITKVSWDASNNVCVVSCGDDCGIDVEVASEKDFLEAIQECINDGWVRQTG